MPTETPRIAPSPARRSPRRVLIIGGTGLLGVALARALAARGDSVTLTARDEKKLASLVVELERVGPGKHRFVCADLLDRKAPEHIIQSVQEAGGVDDILIACGSFPRTPLDTVQREQFDTTLTVHAIAPLLIVVGLANELRASQGSVLALGDGGVTRPYSNHLAYLTAKGAAQAGLRTLALELAPQVRVNILSLGIVSDPEADSDPLRTHRLHSRSPLGRFGTPAEVVQAALALLDATWATGEIWGIGR